MNDLNSVIIEGNLTQDPESTVTKGWTTLCTFPVAVNRYYKKEGERFEEVAFFEIETWGRISSLENRHRCRARGVQADEASPECNRAGGPVCLSPSTSSTATPEPRQ